MITLDDFRDLRALTLWRPWDYPVADGSKPVENRPNPPPISLLGEVIAIHAGQRYDYDGANFIRKNGYKLPHFYEPKRVGAIVGLARIAGWLDRRSADATPQFLRGHNLEERITSLDQDRWWMGPVGILLTEARPMKPVHCRGMQGYWRVPAVAVDMIKHELDIRG